MRKSGHKVLSVSDIGQFVATLRDNEIDLVILGHSLLTHDREDAFRALKESDSPAPVIELYATAVPPKSQAEFMLAVHDRTFQSDLLGLVSQVLSEAKN